jgi:hypothetical protein
VDHDGCWGKKMQALARWQHPVASSEALDVLHWVMRPALHRRIRMVIEVASNLPAFFVVTDYLFAYNLS